MANKPLKRRYRVVEVLLYIPSWLAATHQAKGGVYQQIALEPLPGEDGEDGEAIVLKSAPATSHMDNKIELCCWQDQGSFPVGQEVHLTVEAAVAVTESE